MLARWASRLGSSRLLTIAGAAVAAVVLASLVWLAYGPGSGTEAPIELTLPRADTSPPSSAGGPAGHGGAPSSPSDGVVVHVAGAVASPGLYRLGDGARVADALEAAGGPAADADLDAVNLAGKVSDGERVYLPRRGEVPPAVVAGGGPGGAADGGRSTGPLDLNTATAAQLEALPGVGPATVEAILSYRKEKGRFRSVDELLEVRGIGEAKLAGLRSKVRV